MLLVGAGDMAVEYVKALGHLDVSKERIFVVGNTKAKTEEFSRKTGLLAVPGGLKALKAGPQFNQAIVAVSHTQLVDVTRLLMRKNCRWILLEKPGALYKAQLEMMEREANEFGVQIFIAFNRRFYPSVEKARQTIKDDGGLLSCFFDFTEVEQLVLLEKNVKFLGTEALQRWGIINSLHVIDLFLYFSGIPQPFFPYQTGSMSWHPAAARFCGSGITERGVSFSYLSTWDGAGRWGVELTTSFHKMILRPLEALVWQERGKFQLDQIEVTAEPEGLKPGFYGQVRAFLEATAGKADDRLCPLPRAIEHFAIAEKILGY